jgi:hypothetical protein
MPCSVELPPIVKFDRQRHAIEGPEPRPERGAEFLRVYIEQQIHNTRRLHIYAEWLAKEVLWHLGTHMSI